MFSRHVDGHHKLKRWRVVIHERSINRGSFIAGTSAHNQCIEGLLDELKRCVVRHFRNLYFFLKNEGFLDLLNEVHLFALHYIYMPALKKPLKSLATIGDIIHYLVKGISHYTNF